MIVFAASMAVVFVAGFAFRAWHLRSIERLSTDRRPLGADGIVVGAEGFTLARAEAPAVLLIHGAGDTPQTLRYLGDALFANGFHVEAPLLPGHGRTLAAFRRTSADDWMNAVRSSYSALQCDHDWVAIAGLSMGGALAIRVAAESPQLPALCLIAPYLALREGADRGEIVPLVGPNLPRGGVERGVLGARSGGACEESRIWSLLSRRSPRVARDSPQGV